MPGRVGDFAIDCSPYGVRALAGGAREWMSDPYRDDYPELIDGKLPPLEPEDGPRDRVMRGGSWLGTPTNCRASTRIPATQGFRIETTGFRLARDLV